MGRTTSSNNINYSPYGEDLDLLVGGTGAVYYGFGLLNTSVHF